MLEALELTTKVLSDPLPQGKVDAIFLFSTGQAHQSSILDSAIALYHLQIAEKIIIADGQPMTGFDAASLWKQHLTQHNVGPYTIELLFSDRLTRGDLLQEAQLLVDHAHQHQLDRVILMSTPFEQLKAFMATVSAITDKCMGLNCYNQPGAPLLWNDVIAGKERETKTRDQLIYETYKDIETLQLAGRMQSFSKALDYLKLRKQ